MVRAVIFFLKRLYWKFTGRCFWCGVRTIDWSGYMSFCPVCPLCDMKLHWSKVYRETWILLRFLSIYSPGNTGKKQNDQR